MTTFRPLVLVCCITGWGIPAPAYGSHVVVHRSGTIVEDGVPGLDPDATSFCQENICAGGTRDGQGCNKDSECPDVKDNKLRWQAGTVHVVSDGYTVNGGFDQNSALVPFELSIEAGAIVKIAATCTPYSSDPTHPITSCQPTTSGGGQLFVSDNSVLKVEGATITDIRDDSVGGDTNNDGSSTTPAPSYLLRFGGTPGETLLDSTIKYAALVGHFGSMSVERNLFLQSGGVGTHKGSSIYDTHPPVRGSVPSIEDNYFEFVSGTSGSGVLDVRGQSAIVWGNEFAGNGGAVVIGPTWENLNEFKNPIPEDGITIVANNDITTREAIVTAPPPGNPDTILQQVRFRAEIHHNRLVGPGTPGSIGLGLSLYSETRAHSNSVENYAIPLQFRSGGVAYPATSQTAALIGLHLHGNSFSLTGAQTGPFQPFDTFWKDFNTMVDAENNWWGHLTGPKDASNSDSLVNARGLGLAVSNGIDYVPFLGAAAIATIDSIHLKAGAFPPPPLAPDSGDVLITVNVDNYTLASASTGTITIYVRDSQGEMLVTPVSKAVSSSNHEAEFNTITLPSVPKFTSAVVVEAVLVPDRFAAEEVHSKPKLFYVTRPRGEFRLQCVDDVDVSGNCDPVELVPGTTSNLAFRIAYKFNGTVYGHIQLEERYEEGGGLARAFPTIDFIAPPSPFGTSISQFTSYLPPLSDVTKAERFLSVHYWAEDDLGVEIASHRRSQDIANGANYVSAQVTALDTMLNKRGSYNGHLLAGEHPKIKIDLIYNIAAKNRTNWRVQLAALHARNPADMVLHAYGADPAVLLNNLATGRGSLVNSIINLEEEPALPPGTHTLRLKLQLFAPDEDVVVHELEFVFPVFEAEAVVTKSISAGVSNSYFSPVPFELKVTANPTAGDLTVEEIIGAIANPGTVAESQLLLEKERSVRAAGKTRLIPMNRHFSLYDTLSDTGLSATVTFGYDPDEDFPDDPGFDEDALVVAALNPLSGVLEALPSTHNEAQHTVTAAYDSFFEQWTIASETTAPAAGCADPTADGKTTAADALIALRASVGSSQCATCVCDVNNNGKVTASDALLILRVAVGQLPAPSCAACG